MVVEMSVTGTVVQIERHNGPYGWFQADMLLLCELTHGGEGLSETSEGPIRMPLGVLGAQVRIVDDWALPALEDLKIGDLVYACGSWQAPGSHDLAADMRFFAAARDWYQLENWDAGEAGKFEVRAVDMIGFDVRRYILKEGRWERLTEELRSWDDPTLDDAGWNAHRTTVGRYLSKSMAWDQEAVETLDRDARIGIQQRERRREEEAKNHARAERIEKRNQLAKIAKSPEVEAQKEAARQLARRGRKGKKGKRRS